MTNPTLQSGYKTTVVDVKLIEDGIFTYPEDIQYGSPFIYLAAYKRPQFTDAADWKNQASARSSTSGDYESVFALHVPKGLKYNYSPQINSMRAIIDSRLINSGGKLETMMKGAAATGSNLLALDGVSGLLGTTLNALKDYRSISKGQIMDPKQMNMFADAPFMTYNLNYKFIPESIGEARNIDLMLRVLRYLSMARMGSTQTLQQFLGTSAKVADAAIKHEKALRDRTDLDKIKPVAQQYVDYRDSIMAGKDRTTNQKLEAIGNYKKALVANGSVKTNNPTVDDHYKGDIDKIAEDLKVTASKTPAEKIWIDHIVDKTSDLLEDMKLGAKDLYDAIMGMQFDVWDHPYIFDMYMISPPGDESDAKVTVSINHEVDMFKYAKGLILSGLNISYIESSNRDDVPWTPYGLPVGWDVEMTFTSITKHVIPSGGNP